MSAHLNIGFDSDSGGRGSGGGGGGGRGRGGGRDSGVDTAQNGIGMEEERRPEDDDDDAAATAAGVAAAAVTVAVASAEGGGGGGGGGDTAHGLDLRHDHSSEMLYLVDDVPPWHMCLFLGMQHYLMMFGATLAIPLIICPRMCIEDDDPAKGNIMSTIIFVSGVVTFLQSTFGVRLPIVQGGTFSFLVPTFAILALEHNRCPEGFERHGWPASYNYTESDKTEQWQLRMREVQGAIIAASVFQLVAGYAGIVGAMLRFITPLTIGPAVAMIGLALFQVAADTASLHWGVSMGTVLLLVLFSQYMRDLHLPICVYRSGGCRCGRLPFFKLFPVLSAIVFMWALCAALTAAGVFPEGSPARTDARAGLLARAPLVRVPYPFQWGWPRFTVAGVVGMLAGVVASAIESVGDYYACARLSGAPPPPPHAINRGIGTEGLGCIIAGIWGTGNGTTSYSENIGAIGITKVGSRRVIQSAAATMVFFGLLSKVAAFFVTIPAPIVGGVFCVMFGVVAAVGLSSTQFVDMNSSRNLFVLGFSLFFGLMLPDYLNRHPGSISTGSDLADQVLEVLLTTSMFVSGFLGFVLDNTVPGTDAERGLTVWRALSKGADSADTVARSRGVATYDLPVGMEWLRRQRWAKLVPSLPTYQGSALRRAILPDKITKAWRQRQRQRRRRKRMEDTNGEVPTQIGGEERTEG